MKNTYNIEKKIRIIEALGIPPAPQKKINKIL